MIIDEMKKLPVHYCTGSFFHFTDILPVSNFSLCAT